ncbi:putative defensin-like protein 180 [Papaver somniferum]|uniref:putative defensin-like protein 180 n=1 Tax=Papaver somniferum TaxID=3469 RepID=UPI000E6F5B64|nr:putative defensin-like protein 180 [Papaver somniferum]
MAKLLCCILFIIILMSISGTTAVNFCSELWGCTSGINDQGCRNDGTISCCEDPCQAKHGKNYVGAICQEPGHHTCVCTYNCMNQSLPDFRSHAPSQSRSDAPSSSNEYQWILGKVGWSP